MSPISYLLLLLYFIWSFLDLVLSSSFFPSFPFRFFSFFGHLEGSANLTFRFRTKNFAHPRVKHNESSLLTFVPDTGSAQDWGRPAGIEWNEERTKRGRDGQRTKSWRPLHQKSPRGKKSAKERRTKRGDEAVERDQEKIQQIENLTAWVPSKEGLGGTKYRKSDQRIWKLRSGSGGEEGVMIKSVKK